MFQQGDRQWFWISSSYTCIHRQTMWNALIWPMNIFIGALNIKIWAILSGFWGFRTHMMRCIIINGIKLLVQIHGSTHLLSLRINWWGVGAESFWSLIPVFATLLQLEYFVGLICHRDWLLGLVTSRKFPNDLCKKTKNLGLVFLGVYSHPAPVFACITLSHVVGVLKVSFYLIVLAVVSTAAL